LRAARGESLRQLGERLGWEWSLFGKMEKGETLGGPEVVQALDTYYGTPGLLLALWELAVSDKSQFKEGYRRYMALEAEATNLWHFAVSVLPGLLQTEGYAREVLAAGGLKGDALEQQVEARMGRRELLVGELAPPFRTILSEAVLRTPLQDAGEWQRQLEYLAEMSERADVTVQMLPQRAGPQCATWHCPRPSRGSSSYACWRKCHAIPRPERRELAQEQLQQPGRRRVPRSFRRLRRRCPRP
jgi:hypothetical protein